MLDNPDRGSLFECKHLWTVFRPIVRFTEMARLIYDQFLHFQECSGSSLDISVVASQGLNLVQVHDELWRSNLGQRSSQWSHFELKDRLRDQFFASLEWHSILWLEYPTTLSRVFGHKIQFIAIIYFIYRLLLMYSTATSVTLDFTNSFIHSKVRLILNSLGMKRSTQTYINHFKFISTSKMNFISFLFLFMQINASQSLFRGYDRRQLRRKHLEG